MNQKRNLIIAVMLLVGFGLTKVLDFRSSPQSSNYNTFDEQKDLRVFSKKDLFENQNFSEDINRLRTSSFKDIEKKIVVGKSDSNKSKKIVKAKDKKKKLKRGKQKKKKKDKKKEDLEESDNTNVAEKPEGLSGDSLLEMEPQGLVIESPVDDKTNTDITYWIDLLSSQATDLNYEAFYQAFLSGELSASSYYQVHIALYDTLSPSNYVKSVSLLLKDKSLASFSLLFDYQYDRASAFSQAQLSAIETNLNLYSSTITGLSSLAQVFRLTDNGDKKLLAASILMASSTSDLQSTNSSSDRNLLRGEINSSESTTIDKLRVYQSILALLTDPSIQSDLGEARSQSLQLLDFLVASLPSEDIGLPGRSSSRI